MIIFRQKFYSNKLNKLLKNKWIMKKGIEGPLYKKDLYKRAIQRPQTKGGTFRLYEKYKNLIVPLDNPGLTKETMKLDTAVRQQLALEKGRALLK